MKKPKPCLLIVDDEPLNLEVIEENLEHTGYRLVTAENGFDALKLLRATPEEFDAVLLDRMMPGMDGIEVLKAMKQDRRLQVLPVILQTAASRPEQVAEGLKAGAFYYLTKPYNRHVLCAVIETALRNRVELRAVRESIDAREEALSLMEHARFAFSTPAQARVLARLLSGICPTPQAATIGLVELMLNAIEHGNLAITYDEKSVLIGQNRLNAEVERRLRLPEYSQRQGTVEFSKESGMLTFVISDRGDGFDWRKYIDMDVNRLMHNHGRGIAISASLVFSKLEYRGCGNVAVAKIALNVANMSDEAEFGRFS